MKKNVEVVLDEVRCLGQRIKGAETALRAVTEEQTVKLKELYELIRKGATTGDVIRDFAITAFGKIDSEEEVAYRAINEALKGRKGQYVLVHWGEHERTICNIIADPGDGKYRFRSKFLFGILNGDELIFTTAEKPSCRLPVRGFVEEGVFQNGDIVVQDDPIDLVNGRNFVLHKKGDGPFRSFEHRHDPYRRLVIGTEEVRQWLISQIDYYFLFRDSEIAKRFKEITERLGYFELTSPEEIPSEAETPLSAEVVDRATGRSRRRN